VPPTEQNDIGKHFKSCALFGTPYTSLLRQSNL